MSNIPGAPATRAFRIDPFIIALLIAAALGLLLPARGGVATMVEILKTAAIGFPGFVLHALAARVASAGQTAPRARSVLVVYAGGGISHHDAFDRG